MTDTATGDATPAPATATDTTATAATPMPNHRGIVTLNHYGRAVPLRFSWHVFDHLQKTHGLEAWMDDLARAIDSLDINAMADLMALVAKVPIEQARDLCVPVLPAKTALMQAWTAGMNGNMPADDEAEKILPQLTLWGLLSKLRFGQASDGATSGTSHRTQPA